MKKIVIRTIIVALLSTTLMSCITRHECPTQKDANGNGYLDRNACSETTYLAGLIPLG